MILAMRANIGIQLRRGVIILAASLLAVACMGTDAGPRYDVRYSPIPVPKPKAKPKVPVRVAVAQREPVAGSRPKALPNIIVVKRGDTLTRLARRGGQTVKDMIAANNLKAPYKLRVGQRLRIPGGQTGRAAGETKIALAKPPPRDGKGFLWPVQGPVISTYGPKSGGLYNDGINIRVKAGTPVHAAEAGIVAYASDELKGFGNLILIRHADGYVTAYAHNDQILVRPGTRVARGEMIARAGDSGAVRQSQLHFEIRKGSTALDPLDLLPRPGV